ncbi:hypothetical protein GGI02_002060 [Coemansia sp. RSA 2322]|nr:hypothetical protein GGI02_002060 [Coemansia sp. RSA 2322]
MPPRRPRNLRSSNKSASEWDDEVASPDSSTNVPAQLDTNTHKGNGGPSDDGSSTPRVGLDDLLEFQKYRRQKHQGIDVDTLAKAERKRSQHSKNQQPTNDGNEEDEVADATGRPAGLSTTRSLSGAFTVQTNKLDANKHMMEYIETEMGKHRGAPSAGQDCPAADQGREAAKLQDPSADDLYQVPKHLRIVEERPVSEGNVAMASKMLTSIQEVDLGAESKARNARATNKIVSGLSQTGSSSGGSPRTDPLDRQQSNTRFRTLNNSSDRSSKATDDIALQRFKKRMRR